MKTKFIKNLGLVALIAGLCVCDQAFAAGATDVKSKLQTILDVVQACGVVIATGSIVWAGFKVAWQGESLRNVSGPLIGGIIVGCAAYFGTLLVN